MSLQKISLFAIAATMATGSAMAASPSATGSASALDATVTVAGQTQSLTNQLFATFKAPPAGSKTAPAKKDFTIAKSYFGVLNMTYGAHSATDTASGTNLVGGAVTATGSSVIAAPKVTMTVSANTVLTATAKSISSLATVTRTASSTATPTTSVTISGLTLSSALFGINIANKSLTTKKQTQLATNAAGTVTVFANYQTKIMTGGKQTGVIASAVDIHLNSFPYGPYKISGDIAVATSTAK